MLGCSEAEPSSATIDVTQSTIRYVCELTDASDPDDDYGPIQYRIDVIEGRSIDFSSALPAGQSAPDYVLEAAYLSKYGQENGWTFDSMTPLACAAQDIVDEERQTRLYFCYFHHEDIFGEWDAWEMQWSLRVDNDALDPANRPTHFEMIHRDASADVTNGVVEVPASERSFSCEQAVVDQPPA